MDGLLLHDGFETYYAGKKKPREAKPANNAPQDPAIPQTLTTRPPKWPPRSKDTSGEATSP